MAKNNLNKSSLSKACDIPYTTIDGWYKKGYEGLKLTTLRKLSGFFGTSLDFWASDNVTPPAATSARELFAGEKDEIQLLSDYRMLNEGTKNLARGIIKGLAVSERFANAKGETIVLPITPTEELAKSIDKLEPEYKQALLDAIEQSLEDQKS